MHREADFLTAIAADPGDAVGWLALADLLEEDGQPDRAELTRLREWLRFAELTDPQRPDKERQLATLLSHDVEPPVPRYTIPLAGKISLTLALIPPGYFWMGNCDEEVGLGAEFPCHRVTITQPYWIGVTSVTNAQWLRVCEPGTGLGPKPAHPRKNVLWTEANKFCKKLGKQVGGSFRLPTEAEWEYACRAGVSTGCYLGNAASAKAAWYAENSNGHTHPVAKKKPNAWGLYDMLGNLWDWCSDGERTYTKEAQTDPVGPDGPRRVVKGGAWRSSEGRCRANARYPEEARRQTDDQGFRIVMDWQGSAR